MWRGVKTILGAVKTGRKGGNCLTGVQKNIPKIARETRREKRKLRRREEGI